MSYHRFGQFDLRSMAPIQQAPAPTGQPSSGITPMTTIQINPMLEPSSGDKAMILEMQARTGTRLIETTETMKDPAVFQQPEVRTVAPSYEQPRLPSGETRIAPVAMPIITQGAPVTEPMPVHPVVGMSKPTGTVTTFVPETGLYPAQPSGPVSVPYPCPSGQKAVLMKDGKIHCVSPTFQNEGPITAQAPPPVGPITEQASPPAGQIPPGTSSTGPINNGYVSPSNGYAQQAAAAQTKKSSIVPIAIAAGAALLLSRLL